MSNFVSAIDAKVKSDLDNTPSRYKGRLPKLLEDISLFQFAV